MLWRVSGGMSSKAATALSSSCPVNDIANRLRQSSQIEVVVEIVVVVVGVVVILNYDKCYYYDYYT